MEPFGLIVLSNLCFLLFPGSLKIYVHNNSIQNTYIHTILLGRILPLPLQNVTTSIFYLDLDFTFFH